MGYSQAGVLVADRDRAFAAQLGGSLAEAGFRVSRVESLAAIEDRIEETAPDLLIMERQIDDVSGIKVVRELKTRKIMHGLPIIMTASGSDHVDLIRALDAGADDFVHKPVTTIEITARARALLRRVRPQKSGERLEHGDIVVEMETLRAFRGDVALKLGPTEFNILATFVAKPRRVWTREQLLATIWGPNAMVELRTVDVHLGRLRKALRGAGVGDPFRTVRGIGYALD